ncbi:hypothetical protein BDR26DRAFT_862194 [Obelidium mucronatum]|nr:hypothetical protein BDR26DRAFT_862194 [Obelidium mucronatum]
MRLPEDTKSTTFQHFRNQLAAFLDTAHKDKNTPLYSVFKSHQGITNTLPIHAIQKTTGAKLSSLDAFARAFVAAMYGSTEAKLAKVGDYAGAPDVLFEQWNHVQKRKKKHAFELDAPVKVVDANKCKKGSVTAEVERVVLATEDIPKGRILGLFDGSLNYSRDLEKEVTVVDRYERERYSFSLKSFEDKKQLCDKSQDYDQDFIVEAIRDNKSFYSWVFEVNDVVDFTEGGKYDFEHDYEKPHDYYMREPDKKRDTNVARFELICLGWPYIFLVAFADIPKGEELLMDYNTEWSNQWQHRESYMIYHKLLVPITDTIKNDLHKSAKTHNSFVSINRDVLVSQLDDGLKPPSVVGSSLSVHEKQALKEFSSSLAEIDKTCADLSMTFCLPLLLQPSLTHEFNYEKSARNDEKVEKDVIGWVDVLQSGRAGSSTISNSRMASTGGMTGNRLVKRDLKRRKYDANNAMILFDQSSTL